MPMAVWIFPAGFAQKTIVLKEKHHLKKGRPGMFTIFPAMRNTGDFIF
jgi:hypothetical protein